jgi:hypothetical protein
VLLHEFANGSGAFVHDNGASVEGFMTKLGVGLCRVLKLAPAAREMMLRLVQRLSREYRTEKMPGEFARPHTVRNILPT